MTKTLLRVLAVAFLVVAAVALIWIVVDSNDDDDDVESADAVLTEVAATGVASLVDTSADTAATIQERLRATYNTTVSRVEVSNVTASIITSLSASAADDAVRICESALSVVEDEALDISFVLVTTNGGDAIVRSANGACAAAE